MRLLLGAGAKLSDIRLNVHMRCYIFLLDVYFVHIYIC